MIVLDGGIELPNPPKGALGFKLPRDYPKAKWEECRNERWQRAYTHCLYTLVGMEVLPLHSMVPRIGTKMMEASEPNNISLRFLGEMEIQGYITFTKKTVLSGSRVKQERNVKITDKLRSLDLGNTDPQKGVIKMPLIVGEERVDYRIPIVKGTKIVHNQRPLGTIRTLANEKFVVNRFIEQLIKVFPPVEDDQESEYMYNRMLHSAKKLHDKAFRFPYYADSRSRDYTDTTCGISPQGADHEKAIIQPVHAEPLTDRGYQALLEAAKGYSEQDWSPSRMAEHASNPDTWEKEWKTAEKPYSYMACANMILQYLDNPDTPLPAFIPLDGRCSGLQHWSALARSSAITSHIGMELEEADLDIYEYVAEEWKITLPDHHKKYATRKSAKIPVMTWTYNATRMTSMEHMHSLFGAPVKWDIDKKEFVQIGEGLAKCTSAGMGISLYNSLSETLGDLQTLVNWVTECADIISKAGHASIDWPTPDGFVATQRKLKALRLQLEVKLSTGDELIVELKDFSDNLPNPAKHRSAIAANVIHSLDATHLRMVSRRMEILGLPMIGIHDSFATHVNYRDILYREIVSTFIELYSTDNALYLALFWTLKYDVLLPEIPPSGDWDVSKLVYCSKFFI